MKGTVAYLNSNDGSSMLAFGERERIRLEFAEDLKVLEDFFNRNQGLYLFGCLSYDLKQTLHGLTSDNEDTVNFPDVIFWTPEYVVRMDQENFEFLQGEKTAESLDFVNKVLEEETNTNFHHYDFAFRPRLSKLEYLDKVTQLKSHIQRGDIYEVNFCQEFIAENVEIKNLWDTYFKLNHLTQAPHSAFVAFDEFAVFCGSPERFLRKTNERLISQPIKGTARRSADPKEDERLKNALQNDPKERSENVMIVDLVRNDLSRLATKDSVTVDELCGAYTYETVHQLISTISCEMRSIVSFSEIMQSTFPMGSMTGAPKRRAMELIESHENFKRGLFSGSIGYIDPKGDFDFNVVIRTLIYNSDKNILSCSVGSAVTIHSDPEKEYEECLVKVRRIMEGINE
jgi:para-aminobenzoate synthetase component 1